MATTIDPNAVPTPAVPAPDPNAVPTPAVPAPDPNAVPTPAVPATDPNAVPTPPVPATDPNAVPTPATDPNAIPTPATDPNAIPVTDPLSTDSLITDSLSTDTLSTLTSSTTSIQPVSAQTPTSSKSKGSVGLIAVISGAAVAAAVIILVLGIWFCRRRKYKPYRRPPTRTETTDAQIGYILRGEGNASPFTPSNNNMTPPIGGVARGDDQRSSISANNAGHSVADSIAEVPATSTDSRRGSIVVPTPVSRVDIRRLDAALNNIQGRDPFGDPMQYGTEGSTSVRSSPANTVGHYGAYSTSHSRMQSTSTPPPNQGELGDITTVSSSLNNNGSSFRPMETAHVQDFGSVGSRNYGGTAGLSRTLRQQQLGQQGGSFDPSHRANDSTSSTSGQSSDDRVKELLLQRGFL